MVAVLHLLSAALMCSCVSSLIIPDEITSLLSLIYSNIPPIKKGTDSRVGVGFRLGPHADFQVVLELGPQSETQPIGPSAETKRRRQSDVGSLVNTKQGNTVPPTWLSKWRTSMGQQNQKSSVRVEDQTNQLLKRRSDTTAPPRKQRPTTEPTKLEEDDVVKHLHQLYDTKNATDSSTNTTDIS